MNIYLQVLSQVQTAEIARLLLLPAELQAGPSGCHLKMSGGGKVQTRSFGVVDKAVADLQTSNFNQLEVAYSIARDGGFRLPGNPISVAGLLTVSPTCDLWFKSQDWPASGERAMRTRKMNAKAAEAALNYYKVSRKPSIFEVVIETETTEPKEKVLDACAEWLAKCVPIPLGSLGLFGCVDAGGPEFFVKLESNVLTTEHIRIMAKLLPSTYPDLGQRFDALHPVMFGSKQVCLEIGAALEKDARVIVSPSIRDFAVVRLGVGYEAEAASRRVSPWILPCTGEPPVSRQTV